MAESNLKTATECRTLFPGFKHPGNVTQAIKDKRPEVRKALKGAVLFACVTKQAKFFGEVFGDVIPNTEDHQRGWLVLAKSGVPPKLFEAYDQGNWSYVSMLFGIALTGIEHGRLGNPPSGI